MAATYPLKRSGPERDVPIRNVVVLGGGIAGWSAAAALKRHLPALSVTIVPVPPPADALTDRIASTLPSIREFHEDLGLRDEDTVLRTGSGYRLGTLFERWADKRPDYVHAYGEHGRPFGTSSFHHHWVRAARAGPAAPFDQHSGAAMLARAGRFAPPPRDPASPFARAQHGLSLDLSAYRAMIAAFARHLGVSVRGAGVAGVRLRAEDGFVAALALDDGTDLAADLFVDASGSAATIRSALDPEWEDWRYWLPCDRLVQVDAPASPDPSPLDRAVAVPAGWRWVAASPGGTSHGLVYSAAHLDDVAAARALRGASGVRDAAAAAAAAVSFAQGTRPQPWARNCVAIGEAATVLEPLEWTGLHLVHSAIDRIVSFMPGRDCAPVELADYNRQAAAEVMRVRDFVILHYVIARRPEPFWQAAAAVEPPPSLARTLALFAERGRLPFFEEETFDRDSWLAVLIGQGMIPRRVDPLVDAVPPFQSDAAMASFREAIAAAVPSFPTASAYLAAQKSQITR